MPMNSGNEKQELIEKLKRAKEDGQAELDVTVDAETLPLVFQIASLKSLTLHTGELETLPLGLGKLTELTSLDLSGNRLVDLPPDIGELAKLERLTAYNNRLSALPKEIGGLCSLRQAVLWSNELTGLPASIGRLAKLEELSLKRNKLASLPEEIGMLANLQKLELENNLLESLPAGLGGMTGLKMLKLTQNRFQQFPEAVFDLPTLEMLILDRNAIAAIPEGISRLGTLRELSMEENQVRALPKGIFATHVAILNLESNQITEVPKEIGAMHCLVELNLEANPVANVPESAIKEGKDAIFEHLGLVKALTVSGDLPTGEKERQAIVGKYKDRMEEFVRQARSEDADQKMTGSIVAFLSGKSDTVPPARIKDYDGYRKILDILAPYPEWTFVDRRLLRFIAQDAWHFINRGSFYEQGYHQEFLFWLRNRIGEETDENLFGKVAAELPAFGIDAAVFLRLALAKLDQQTVRADQTPTSFGRYLLASLQGNGLAAVMEVARKQANVRTALTALLSANDPETFARVAQELLKIEPLKNGEIHIPGDSLKLLCAREPDRYEALLLDGIARTGCLNCKAEGTRILAECYCQKHGEQAFALACEVLREISKVRNSETHFRLDWPDAPHKDGTPKYISWMLAHFGERAKAAVLAYANATKVYDIDVAAAVANGLGQAGIDIVAEGLNMEIQSDSIAAHYRQLFPILAPLDYSKYLDKVWEIAQSEFPKVRETACLALGRLDAKIVLPKAKELLAAKKSHQREAGVLILTLLRAPEAREILTGLLDTETTDDVRDVAVAALFEDAKPIAVAEALRRVASAKQRRKLDKPAAKWLDDARLPPLQWTDGSKLDLDVVRFLLYRQTRAAGISPDPEARDVYPLIDRQTSGDFAEALLQLALNNGGVSAKTRFAIVPVAMLGDGRAIAPIERIAIEGTNPSACAALGLLGSFEAARALDRIRKVFRIKYPNVRQAAQEAFAGIAANLGRTPFELSDLMAPDFGLKNGRRPFPVGNDQLELVLTPDRKFDLVDAKGKSLKSLPKSAAETHKTELKELRKSLADAVRQLGWNLEYYLIVQRRWSGADWQAFFNRNPLAAAFASGLVWGIYRGNALQAAFRLQSDGSLAGRDGKGVTVGKDTLVGMVHPLELAPEDRAAWQTALGPTAPPFPQMDRPVFAVDAKDCERTLCFAFEDRRLNALTFKGRAERRGWRRGSVIDSGEVSAYRKEWPHHSLESFLRLEGMGVSADFESDTTLKDFFFVRTGSIVTGSYTYDEPRDKTDPRLLKLGDVPPIVYSETLADLHFIADKKAAEDEA